MVIYLSHNPISHPEITNTTDEACLQHFADCPLVSIDTENNSLDVFTAEPLLTSISDGRYTVVVDNTTIDLKGALPVNDKQTFIGQNLVYDLAIFIRQGIFLPAVHDLMVADQVMYRGATDKRFDLVSIHQRYLNFVPEHMNKDTRMEFTRMAKRSAKEMLKDYHILYSGADVSNLIDIYHLQAKRLAKTRFDYYVKTIANPLLLPVAEMHLDGFILKQDALINLIHANEDKAFQSASNADATLLRLRDEFFDLEPGERLPNYYYLCGDKFTRKRWKHPKTENLGLFGEVSQPKKAGKTNVGNLNYASTTQMVDLFARLQLPLPVLNQRGEVEDYRIPEFVTKRTKKGLVTAIDVSQYQFTTSKDAFNQMLIERPEHAGIDLVKEIVNYRNYQHYVDSFGYNLLDKTYKQDGKIRTLFRTETAVTGRFQSGGGKQQPNRINFQNIPRLKEFRKLFGVEPGNSVGTIDLSGAEVTIMCDKAHDAHLYDIAVVKDDAHSPIATLAWKAVYLYRLGKQALLWNTPKEFYRMSNNRTAIEAVLKDNPEYKRIMEFIIDKDHNKDMRTQFKAITFGTIYGAKPKKIAKVLNINVDEGEVVHWVITNELKVTYQMVTNNVQFALEHGYVMVDDLRTHTKVWFPQVIHCLKTGEELPRSAYHEIDGGARNYPIQGTQALMIKEAIVEAYRGLPRNYCRILSSVHDELVMRQPFNMDGVSNEWNAQKVALPFAFDKRHDPDWIKEYLLHHPEEYDRHVVKHEGHDLMVSAPYFTKLTMLNTAWRYLRHYKMGADMQVDLTWVK